MAEKEIPLDELEKGETKRGDLRLTRVSPDWAKIAWPVTRAFLALIAAVMLVPFIFVGFFQGDKGKLETVMDWAKTILPPVTGFGGAVIGYYFGTSRSDEVPQGSSSESSDSGPKK